MANNTKYYGTPDGQVKNTKRHGYAIFSKERGGLCCRGYSTQVLPKECFDFSDGFVIKDDSNVFRRVYRIKIPVEIE